MSVDLLQEKIRKYKNPSVLDMTVTEKMIPPQLRETGDDFLQTSQVYCRQMLNALKDTMPAVRFGFSNFALLGSGGLASLQELLDYAAALGYYVILDFAEILSPAAAEYSATLLFSESSPWHFNGLILPTYIGSDGLKPFTKAIAKEDKSVFGVVRTGNKSATELQDLFTGNRLSHMAAADLVNRLGEPMQGKSGYHKVGALAGAASADSLRTLRSKYPHLFLLLDGYDYPNANAKNCSYAFDRLGHGAAACAGSSILGAWMEEGANPESYIQLAVEAAERMKKNLCRYIMIL